MIEVDRERVALVEDFIDANPDEFSIIKYMEENHLFEGRLDKGDSINSKCPFHEDMNPSFFVSVSRNKYNCFSCGKQGGYVRFVTSCINEIDKMEMSYYDVLDEVLKKHIGMRNMLGFCTIFKSVHHLPSGYTRPIYNIRKENIPYSYSELYNFMQERGYCSEPQIVYAILSMQQGRNPNKILQSLHEDGKMKEVIKGKEIDIMNLLSDDDEGD